MMNINGKEEPISIFKFYLHDDVGDALEWIRNTLKLKTNNAAISTCITHCYRQLKAFEEYQLGLEKKKQEEAATVKSDENPKS